MKKKPLTTSHILTLGLGVRVCLDAVYVKLYRALKAEDSIGGQVIEETTAKAAGDTAVFHAKPLSHNRYMVQIAKTMVKRVILACR